MSLQISCLFSVACILYFKESTKGNRKYLNALLFILWIVLIYICGFRSEEMSDYKDYLVGYNTLIPGDFGRWEPGYWSLMYALKSINADFTLLLCVMACISVGIRLYAIEKVTPIVWGSIMVYLSNLFILHDMIQMRCAVASGLLILALYYRVNDKFKGFLVCSIIAILFHYSSIIILPLWFVSFKKSQRNIYIWLIPICYALTAVLGFHISSLFYKLPLIGSYYFEGYAINSQQGEVNIFNALQIIRCFICILIWMFISRMPHNRYLFIFLKVYTLALCCLPLFSDIYVISYRLSEFYLVSEIIVIPYFAYIFRPYVKLGKLAVISISSVFLLMNIFYNKYLI